MRIQARALLTFTSLLLIGFFFLLVTALGLYITAQKISRNQLIVEESKIITADVDSQITSTPTPSISVEERKRKLIDLINQKRIANGASSLKENKLLDQSASLKAQDMLDRGYWAHISPGGIEPWKYFQEVGYNYIYAGENLARHLSSAIPTQHVDAWMNSAEHRKVMLDPVYKEVGIGLVTVTESKPGYHPGEEIAVAHFGSQRTTYHSNAATDDEPSTTGKIVPYHDWCNNKDISVYENEIVIRKSSDGNTYGMTVSDWECYESFLRKKH